ncbi:MAG: MBL fold metallo-hydrolase [Oscillospiraceae bacterium]|nr:MBL fold metallo-hydrolase [Oscillospiraceae bacterium]
MKLTFLGATHEVTGSLFYLNACDKNIVIDYGMEQGTNVFENEPLPIPAGQVDYVLLTHAHIDHSGLIPLLCKNGFKGSIHSTEATADLCSIMLRDSAHIQEFEAEWRNRKGKRAGKPEYIPLYTMTDAESAIEKFTGHRYNEKVDLCEGISIRFIDAGHLLGSSSIEVWVTEEGVTKKLVFSGDLGNLNQPLIRDPQYIKDADYVIMESTYGNRNHSDTPPDYVRDLTDIMQRTFDRGGNVVIPSFAVGRTQEMLYFMRQIKNEGLVKGHDFKVYVDSPLAIEATGVFKENGCECYDDETNEVISRGENPIYFEGLELAVSSEESKAINLDKEPKVIISASGMCEAGRIKHHLKHNLWRKDSTILFVGYQAVNTIGRNIVDGAQTVRLFSETIEVKAEIATLTGKSGHADQRGLFKWIDSFETKPQKVFVVHGDDAVMNIFAEELKAKGYNAYAPYSGTCFDLLKGEFERVTTGVEVKKTYGQRKVEATFARLLAAGKRLMEVIERNRGGANKDLARFASQIDSLCDKWDR